jgi:mRNA interferase MazF
MRRGEVWLVDLDPVRGSEANKRRPAVVVSNDAANSTAEQLGRGVVTVVPVTSNLRRVYPFQTLLPAKETGLRTDTKALAEQVRSVDAQRLSSHIATIPPRLMADVDDALRIHLAL